MDQLSIEIRQYGDPVLRHKCEPVKSFDEAIQQAIAELKDRFEAEHAFYGKSIVGLAATQIGRVERAFVATLIDKKEECNTCPPEAVINPLIVWGEGEEVNKEECLSFNRKPVKVSRYSTIRAQWQNENGEFLDRILGSYAARIFQHELDHLDGILVIDRQITRSRPR